MNNDGQLFDFMTKIYVEMKEGFKRVDERFDAIENEVIKTNNTIENDIKPKIEALFDGYKQNSEKLDRIEAEVIKHDEFILKKVR